MNKVRKIGLGTAQWGMPYGVANLSGQPVIAEVHKMLLLAKQSGVTMLDTAHAYGESEKILGEYNACSLGFEIITKTIPIEGTRISPNDVEAVSKAFMTSLARLNSNHVYGLLVHHADNLLSPGSDLLWEKLKELRLQKHVSKIGVSVYRPQQLTKILGRYNIDLVQAPFNIYDQRFAQTGLFQSLKDTGIEIHTRSAFLQGLLLMKPSLLPDQFQVIRDHQARLHSQLSTFGLTPLEGCLSYCLNQTHIDRVILGCETLLQLAEILDVVQNTKDISSNLVSHSIRDEKAVNPSMWSH